MARLKLPNGQYMRIPEGATQEQVDAAIASLPEEVRTPKAAPAGPPKADFSNVTSNVTSTASAAPTFRNPATGAVETQPERMARLTAQAAAEPRIDPTEGMTGMQKFIAGAGQSADATIRGARQLFNMATGDTEELAQLQAQEAENRRLDAPLLATGAGRGGQIVGHIAQAAMPLGLGVKGAGFGLKAIGTGAGLGAAGGALQPTAREGERLSNVIGGTLAGGLLPGVGGALALKAKVIRNLPGIRQVVDAGIEKGQGKVKAAAKQALDDITTPLRVPASRMVDELRSVKRAYGDDLPASFNKFVDEVSTVAKNNGKMLGLRLQDVRSAIGKEAEKVGGGLSTGLNRAKRAIDDAFDASLPAKEAARLRRVRVEAVTGKSQSAKARALRATGGVAGAAAPYAGAAIRGTAAPYRRPNR